jgi:hypothetical protein
MSIFPKVERRFLSVLFKIASTVAYGCFEAFKKGSEDLQRIDAEDRQHKLRQEGGGK